MNPSAQRLLKTLAYVVVALATGYFVLELVRRFGEIPPIPWNLDTAAIAAVSCLAGVLIVLLIGLMWTLLLRDQGVQMPLFKALQIVAISQIGKYLPGNVGHFAGRAVLARQAGIPLGVTASTLLIETAWTLAIGAGFAVAALALFVDAATARSLPSVGWAELGLLTAGLLVLPWLGIKTVNRFAPGLSRRVGGGKLVTAPRLRTAVLVAGLMVVCFFVLGGVVALHARGLFGVASAPWVTITVLFTSAWLVGYVVPGAPGGIGVREAMMVLVLTPVVGAGPAIGLGVTVRLATLAGDGLAFLLGVWSQRHG
ncbi:hypothetical protein J2W49_000242 [Hydrogenophaga palleronii]|uniref:Flippase-like domain-containing protein n=1 Tax=Hydrogenophaga palleronii TaxID=65655 RepID=A0ABU1WGY1_9BURK|nr:lysylphosphatidylglycerol synthase domain-containing protein [Hydrogenophaga palleronii]MDR7148314.1 hypothetical protein [Hydrogenophaga palleronii]